MLVKPLEIRWEDPPPVRRTWVQTPRVDWPAVAGKLRKERNRWAIITTCDNAPLAIQTAWRVRQGLIEALRLAGRFEATARSVDGEHRVYARYVGGAR